MTPFDKARMVYEKEVCARTFDEDLRLHLKFGYVFSTPDFFLMGRPVSKDAEYHEITDPRLQFPDPDCWLVYLASGDINKFWTICPYDLPYVGWERDNVLRIYRSDKVIRACQRPTVSKSQGVHTTTQTFSIPTGS